MIIRTPKNRDNPYTMVNRFAIGDPGLSMAAKGLLVYLLSLPDDWEVHPKELVKHFANGRDAIYRVINELIKAGYLARTQEKVDGHRFGRVEYVVNEIPALIGQSVFSSVLNPRIREIRTRSKIGDFRAEEQKFIRGERGNVDDFAGMLDDE